MVNVGESEGQSLDILGAGLGEYHRESLFRENSPLEITVHQRMVASKVEYCVFFDNELSGFVLTGDLQFRSLTAEAEDRQGRHRHVPGPVATTNAGLDTVLSEGVLQALQLQLAPLDEGGLVVVRDQVGVVVRPVGKSCGVLAVGRQEAGLVTALALLTDLRADCEVCDVTETALGARNGWERLAGWGPLYAGAVGGEEGGVTHQVRPTQLRLVTAAATRGGEVGQLRTVLGPGKTGVGGGLAHGRGHVHVHHHVRVCGGGGGGSGGFIVGAELCDVAESSVLPPSRCRQTAG